MEYLGQTKGMQVQLKSVTQQSEVQLESAQLPKTSWPLFSWCVAAGFPSPAEDYVDRSIDLHNWLMPKPASNFLVRVTSQAMAGAGVFVGDVLVVDKSLTPKSGNLVIVHQDGEFLVRRWVVNQGKVWLVAEPTAVVVRQKLASRTAIVWGVVTGVVRQVKT